MMATPRLSVVIPVFNSAPTLRHVVGRIQEALPEIPHEIILVNDGSADDSDSVGRQLADEDPDRITYLQLSKNFGEHHAVLAGIAQTRGDFVAILDDDGQNPPEELPRMLRALREKRLDVIYGRYLERKHGWGRRLGSWFNDRMATLMLKKPPGLYLSSFKILNRFTADAVISYTGPYPYLDGLICRTTTRLGEIEVRHDPRLAGKSGYTVKKLVGLWLNMFLGFSILPLRLCIVLGFFTSMTSCIWLFAILVDKLWLTPNLTVGIPTVLACIVLFSGIQLVVLGMVGEYVGRVFLAGNGQPQYIVRYSSVGDYAHV